MPPRVRNGQGNAAWWRRRVGHCAPDRQGERRLLPISTTTQARGPRSSIRRPSTTNRPRRGSRGPRPPKWRSPRSLPRRPTTGCPVGWSRAVSHKIQTGRGAARGAMPRTDRPAPVALLLRRLSCRGVVHSGPRESLDARQGGPQGDPRYPRPNAQSGGRTRGRS